MFLVMALNGAGSRVSARLPLRLYKHAACSGTL
jgi:hypothetical protein